MINELDDILEQLRKWIEDNITLQVDPLASVFAALALIVAMRANWRSAKIVKDERNRAGNISRVAIHEHSLQAAMDAPLGTFGKKAQGTSPRDAGDPEGFVCSVYSGDTDVEVESAYLKIIYTRGFLARERWEVRIDLQMSEGLAVPATALPFRMKRNSRLDWVLPSFVVFFPNGRGAERKLDVTRLMTAGEQLRFEFGAYSRVSAAPSIAKKEHRLSLAGLPLRGGPWTKIVKHSSLWEALTSPDCPDSLKGWFLEWLECRQDFQERIEADKSGHLRRWFHQVVRDSYWPPGYIAIGRPKMKFGDSANDTRGHRVMRTIFAMPDMSLIDSGRTVSGPGGSSELSQVRISLAMSLLSGEVAPTALAIGNSSWPPGLTLDDPILQAAIEARRLTDLSERRPLSQKEAKARADDLAIITHDLSRCAYASLEECDEVVSEMISGRERSMPVPSPRV